METVNPMKPRTVIFTGGSLTITPVVSDNDYVIAADSGYDHARSHGIAVDLLIGDLDSISPESLEDARQRGVPIERFPQDKDASDLELALRVASSAEATEVTVYGGEAGRIDHLIAIALSLTAAEWRDLSITWHTGTGSLHPVLDTKPLVFDAVPGTVVSIIPVGPASGVTTTGLRWQLDDAQLVRGTTHGISNIVDATPCTITVSDGALLVTIGTQQEQS
ncbi:Thiamin pyrophosphokinase [hydrothermal vent metagenome]|uniref:Thiamin pyrophosphokinase n=1 Tax=hydrothermal vent metagenome TaxID=652676 RepID=A0A3B0SEK8_9ZZZZ